MGRTVPPNPPVLTTDNLTLSPAASAAVSSTPTPPATGPAGSWPIVPGVLTVNWTVNEEAPSAEVTVLLFAWQIDSLTGTLSLASQNAVLTDKLGISGIAEGDLSLTANFNPFKLSIAGDLTILGKEIGSFNYPLF